MWTVGEVFVDATYAITVTVLSTTTTGYRIAIAYRPDESAVFLPLLSR